MVRHEETVLNGCATSFINPADEASVTIAFVALEATVELTVAYCNFGFGYAAYETGKTAFAIHGTFHGD
jgi:hypothetical protein